MINFIWSWVRVLKVYFQDKSRLKLLMCFSPFPFVFFESGIEFDNDKALPGSSVYVIRRPIPHPDLPGIWLKSMWKSSYRCDHKFQDWYFCSPNKFPENRTSILLALTEVILCLYCDSRTCKLVLLSFFESPLNSCYVIYFGNKSDGKMNVNLGDTGSEQDWWMLPTWDHCQWWGLAVAVLNVFIVLPQIYNTDVSHKIHVFVNKNLNISSIRSCL
jgi:hypothetical protein